MDVLHRRLSYAEPEDPPWKQWVIRSIEDATGKRRLLRSYERALAEGPEAFFGAALRELAIGLDVDAEQLAAVPREGPVVFVANHPFGVVDGLALCELAMRTRGDFKVLVNKALFKEEALQRFMLPIDFAGTRAAARFNLASQNEAIRRLREGGTVLVFPSGAISTAQGGGFGVVDDLEWKPLTAKLIQKSQATTVPVWFRGENSRLFQVASQISLTLRLSLIIGEVNRMRGRTLELVVGRPIPWRELEQAGDRAAITRHLREAVFRLGEGSERR